MQKDERGNIQIALADGSVHIIAANQEKLKAMLTFEGGEIVSVDD